MPLQDGQTFAGYTILRTLGVGGMGEVYLAQHPRLPRPDALKILPKAAASDEFRQRFNREADLAAQMFHPHIVGIHDRGEEDGQLWISIDYVAGTDANHLMSQRYPSGMPARQAAEIIAAVASALDYAHQRGLLHRDVKPANILLSDPETASQRIFLADFGIARSMFEATNLTAANSMIATIAYASPEQLSGRPMDGRSDQYSLACTAYDLLTGAAPFGGTDPISVVGQHLSMAPPPIGYRNAQLGHLDAVFARALAKDPQARYATCADFAADLTRHIESGRASATVMTPWSPPPPAHPAHPTYVAPVAPAGQTGSSRTLLIVGSVVGALVLIVAAVVATTLLTRDSPPSATPSTQSSAATSAPGETSGDTASPNAPQTGPTRLVVDGQTQELPGRVICISTKGMMYVSIENGASPLSASLSVGDSPVVETVGIGKIDGVSYAYAKSSVTEPAVARKDGETYTITGTAKGVDLANALKILSKQFELVVVCP